MSLFSRKPQPPENPQQTFFSGSDNVPQPKAILPQSTFMENLRKLSVSEDLVQIRRFEFSK